MPDIKEEVARLTTAVEEIQRTLEGHKGSMEALVAFIGTMKALDNLATWMVKAAKVAGAVLLISAAYFHATEDWVARIIK